MAFLPENNFGTNDVNTIVEQAGSGGGLPLIPAGSYVARYVSDGGLVPTSTGGKMLAAKFVIVEGAHQGVELTDRFNFVNANPLAVKIAQESWAKLCKAAGFNEYQKDTTKMVNAKVLIKVKTEAGREYTDKNTGEKRMGKEYSVIGGYDSLPTNGNTPFAPASAPAAPSASMFAPQAPTPSAQQADPNAPPF